MDSKLFLLCFAVFSSCFFAGYCRELQSGGLGGDHGNSTSCLMELLPCEPFLKSSGSPPATCCVPMKKVVANEAECLCNILHNSDIMNSFNVTMDEALRLAKACGANADMSKCNTANSPTGSPTTPSSSTNSSTGGSSSNKSASSSNGIPNFAVLGFIAFLVGLLAI